MSYLGGEELIVMIFRNLNHLDQTFCTGARQWMIDEVFGCVLLILGDAWTRGKNGH